MLRWTLIVTLMLTMAPRAFAQFGGGGGGNQGGGGNPGGGVGGIRIDAAGLVQQAVVSSGSARSIKAELRRSAKSLPADINLTSTLRKVSLAALDREVSRLLAEGTALPAEIRSLAGLTRIDAVWFTETGDDVVIAGPAEGFAAGPDGRIIGIDTGRPVLCLDDLLVALRSIDDRVSVGCSFDPDPARLVQTRTALSQNTFANSLADAQRSFEDTGAVMGNWNVRVMGVPENSRMAVAMVEADFLLKRLTTGAEKSPVRGFKSHLAMMKAGDDVLRRWWFSPMPDVLERNADATAYRLTGQRLRVSGQDELVDASGQRTDAPVTAAALEDYAKMFTTRLPQLAAEYPSLAHLQNLVDVLVTAAVIRQGQSAGTVVWQPDALLDDARLPVESYNVPKETPSIVTVRSAGSRTVIGLIAGGVVITPAALLAEAREADLPEGPDEPGSTWWWD